MTSWDQIEGLSAAAEIWLYLIMFAEQANGLDGCYSGRRVAGVNVWRGERGKGTHCEGYREWRP